MKTQTSVEIVDAPSMWHALLQDERIIREVRRVVEWAERKMAEEAERIAMQQSLPLDDIAMQKDIERRLRRRLKRRRLHVEKG